MRTISNRVYPRNLDITAACGWTRDAVNAIVHLTHVGDTVAIGAAAMVGNEKVRIVGYLRLDDAAADSAVIEMTDGDTAAVSNANEGRLKYDVGNQRWETSSNGAAYVPIGENTWERNGTVVRLVNIADTVAIGAAAMVGTEKLYVVGDTLLDGDISFHANTVAPTISQVAVAGAAQNLVLAAGSSTGAAGGDLLLRGGVGVGTAGDVALQSSAGGDRMRVTDSYMEIEPRGVAYWGMADDGAIRIPAYSAGYWDIKEYAGGAGQNARILAVDGISNTYIGGWGSWDPNSVILAARPMSASGVVISGSGYTTPWALQIHYEATIGDNVVNIGRPNVFFDATVTSPHIYQESAAGAGQTLVVQAQRSTGAAGGVLSLRGGQGSTSHGRVELSTYSGTQMFVAGALSATIDGAQFPYSFYGNWYSIRTTPYTVGVDKYHMFADTVGTGAITINLPSIATLPNARHLWIADNGNAAAANITINPNGADTIAGAGVLVLNNNWASVILVSDTGANNWYIF